MNAVRLIGGRVQVTTDAPPPRPAPGEAIIRPLRVAIGPHELDAIRQPGPDRTPGSEFVGTVEEIEPRPGREEQKKWIGKRVVGSASIVCGTCELCRSGLASHCRQRTLLGTPGRDGCFADRLAIPVANLIEVPRSIEDDAAALLPTVAAAAHATRVVRIEGRPHVTILGDGPAALVIAQIIAPRNPSVRILGTDPARYTLCEKWGIKHRHTDEAGRRHDQDLVIETRGTTASLELAAKLLRPRGMVVLAAPMLPDASADNPGTFLRAARDDELQIAGARGENFPEANSLVESGAVDVLPLIGGRFRLPEAPAALRAAAQPSALKIIMTV